MTGAWKTWMRIWCWIVLGLGIGFLGAAFPATDGFARLFFGVISGFSEQGDLFAAGAMRFATAIIGAITIGWALTLLGLVQAAEKAGAGAWRSFAFALACWFVVDSAISVATGFPLNALSNIGLALGFLGPILASGVLWKPARFAAA